MLFDIVREISRFDKKNNRNNSKNVNGSEIDNYSAVFNKPPLTPPKEGNLMFTSRGGEFNDSPPL
ncbi:MAG: hypothetical protein LBC74_15575 [Planctomycetaceae bacterium]|jgi:hypothetical protein|nr:hypothetical protein [Planctomycetaceae bacterium]